MQRRVDPTPDGREERMSATGRSGGAPEQLGVRETLLRRALAELASHTQSTAPPEGFEARLMARAASEGLLSSAGSVSAVAGRSTPASRPHTPWLQRWAWAPVAFAAIALAFWLGAPRPVPPVADAPPDPRTARVVRHVDPKLPLQEAASQTRPAQTGSKIRPKRRPPAAQAALVAKVVSAGPPTSTEKNQDEPLRPSYSEFVPLEFSSGFPVDGALQAVRVRMNAGDFLRWSLPGTAVALGAQLTHEDRVTADFLVGDDGRPRAIRLVSMDE